MSTEPENIFLCSEYIRPLPKSWLVAFCTCRHVDGTVAGPWCLNCVLPVRVIVLVLQQWVPYSRYLFWGPWVASYFLEREKCSATSRYCAWYKRRGRVRCPRTAAALFWRAFPGCSGKVQPGSYLLQSRSSVPNCHLHLPSASSCSEGE